jgi:hypothetical protein
LVRQLTTYPNSSGQILVQFSKGSSNEAKVSGIEISQTPNLPSVQISSITLSNSTIQITWPAYVGKTYRLQYRDDLAAATWNSLAPDVTATSTTASAVISTTGAHRFFRIQVMN